MALTGNVLAIGTSTGVNVSRLLTKVFKWLLQSVPPPTCRVPTARRTTPRLRFTLTRRSTTDATSVTMCGTSPSPSWRRRSARRVDHHSVLNSAARLLDPTVIKLGVSDNVLR
jgi:hypothetical protein